MTPLTTAEVFLLLTICAEAEDRHANAAEDAKRRGDEGGVQHQDHLSGQFRKIRFKLHQQLLDATDQESPAAL